MLFKHPSILYALFALLIPIFIHLFKLRKFQKTAFTNVAFLEKIKLQTRKSSQLKKWLVLLSRLLLFAAIILAFAEPYLPSASKTTKPDQYIIYLDNSFSMQAKGTNGPLLKRAIQELIEQVDENQVITLFTNTEVYSEVNLSEIQNELMDVSYSSIQLSPKQLVLKAKQLAKSNKNVAFLAISDFQKHSNFDFTELNTLPAAIVQLEPEELKNAAIDSLWLTNESNELQLKIKVSSHRFQDLASLSVHNGELLVGKAQVDFAEQPTHIVNIPLPKNTDLNGFVQMDSPGLSYDNTRYFSINKQPKTKVLVIGSAPSAFLNKIYTEQDFKYNSTSLSNLNYADISKMSTIVLNELESLPEPLQQNLIEFTKQGGILSIIPSATETSQLVNFLQNNFGIALGNYTKTSKKLTHITFEHPVFNDVFTKKIDNFQYPTINEFYSIKGENAVLRLEDNSPFLVQQGSVFLFAAPLNEKTTNFKQSPIIVPCFYNMAKQNTPITKISYSIGTTNQINIPTTIQNQDNVLHVKNATEQFIPLQQIYRDYISITTTDIPHHAGNYDVTNQDKIITHISFNYPTTESSLNYAQITPTESTNYSNSVSEYLTATKAAFQITALWKWFLIFALFFVAIEILLLKFLK